jgi:phosphatidylglycerophosphate synthase
MVRVRLKARDAWWTVLVIDPIAGPLVRLVAPFHRITPNRLTLLSIVLAVGAAVAFANGSLVVGALVYQASFLVDCMDGKLAAVRGSQNPWGGFIDQLGDHSRFLVCLSALTYASMPEIEAEPLWAVAVGVYACARFSLLVLGEARPNQRVSGHVTAAPTPLAILRTAPNRMTKPGTSVDTETVAYTLAPLAGEPLIGIAIAAAVDLLHVGAMVASGLRVAARSRNSVAQDSPRD